MNNFLFFDISALTIIGTMVFAVFFRKTYKGMTNLIFLGSLVCSLLAVTCRTISLTLENYIEPSASTRQLLYVFMYASFFFLNFVIPLMFVYMYSAIDILQVYRKNYLLRIVMEILTFFPVVYLITNIFTDKLFYIDENLHYVYYPAILLLPLFTLFILIMSLFILFYYKKIISKSGFKIAVSICFVNIVFSIANFQKS